MIYYDWDEIYKYGKKKSEDCKLVTISYPSPKEISPEEAITWVDNTLRNNCNLLTTEPLIQAQMIEVLFGRVYAVAFLSILMTSTIFVCNEDFGNATISFDTKNAMQYWNFCNYVLDGEVIENSKDTSIFSINVFDNNKLKHSKFEYKYIPVCPMAKEII